MNAFTSCIPNRHTKGHMVSKRGILASLCLSLALVSACTSSKENVRDGKVEPRVPPNEPWRAERPAPGEAPEVKLPTFEKATLKNGLTVLVATEPALPIVEASVIVRGGGLNESAREAGLASLTYDMLDEGAGDMDALALADAVAALGTSAHVWSGREAGGLGMQLLKRNLDEGVGLLALMAQKPRFESTDFERVKARHLSSLKSKAGDPRSVASDVFALTMYGEQHAYGWPASGTEQTVSKLNARRAKKFWSEIAGPKSSALVFSGDITLEEATKLAEAHFGKWRGRAQPPKAPKDPKPMGKTTLRVVDFPGTPQTVVVVGRPLLKKGDPDEPALLVFNQVLGGMFSSRLNLNLREAKGWTYGAWSAIDPRAGTGPFQAGAGIKTEHTAEALAEVFKEFEALRTSGVKGEDELSAAKDNYVKSLPGRFETLGDLSTAAGTLFMYSLPMDYYAKLPERISAVSAEDVKRVAERALVKDDMAIILVGDKAAIEEGINGLELGELIVVDPHGQPIKN